MPGISRDDAHAEAMARGLVDESGVLTDKARSMGLVDSGGKGTPFGYGKAYGGALRTAGDKIAGWLRSAAPTAVQAATNPIALGLKLGEQGYQAATQVDPNRVAQNVQHGAGGVMSNLRATAQKAEANPAAALDRAAFELVNAVLSAGKFVPEFIAAPIDQAIEGHRAIEPALQRADLPAAERGAGQALSQAPFIALDLAGAAAPALRTAVSAAAEVAPHIARLERAVALHDPSTLRMFIGPTAKTWDAQAAARAEAMEAAGASADDIWRETGTGRGADGKWRQEIDDSGTRLSDEAIDFFHRGEATDAPAHPYSNNASRVVEHPAFYAAYPDLAGRQTMVVRTKDPAFARGSYEHRRGGRIIAEAPDTAAARSIVLHENQHAVQRQDAFAVGGTPENMLMDELDAINARMSKIVGEKDHWRSYARNGPQFKAEADENLARLSAEYDALMARRAREITPQAQRDAYKRLAGETEARNVQTRRDFTPEERRARPPWATEDVPRSEQIVRFDGGEAQSIMGALRRIFAASPEKTTQKMPRIAREADDAETYGRLGHNSERGIVDYGDLAGAGASDEERVLKAFGGGADLPATRAVFSRLLTWGQRDRLERAQTPQEFSDALKELGISSSEISRVGAWRALPPALAGGVAGAGAGAALSPQDAEAATGEGGGSGVPGWVFPAALGAGGGLMGIMAVLRARQMAKAAKLAADRAETDRVLQAIVPTRRRTLAWHRGDKPIDLGTGSEPPPSAVNAQLSERPHGPRADRILREQDAKEKAGRAAAKSLNQDTKKAFELLAEAEGNSIEGMETAYMRSAGADQGALNKAKPFAEKVGPVQETVDDVRRADLQTRAGDRLADPDFNPPRNRWNVAPWAVPATAAASAAALTPEDAEAATGEGGGSSGVPGWLAPVALALGGAAGYGALVRRLMRKNAEQWARINADLAETTASMNRTADNYGAANAELNALDEARKAADKAPDADVSAQIRKISDDVDRQTNPDMWDEWIRGDDGSLVPKRVLTEGMPRAGQIPPQLTYQRSFDRMTQADSAGALNSMERIINLGRGDDGRQGAGLLHALQRYLGKHGVGQELGPDRPLSTHAADGGNIMPLLSTAGLATGIAALTPDQARAADAPQLSDGSNVVPIDPNISEGKWDRQAARRATLTDGRQAWITPMIYKGDWIEVIRLDDHGVPGQILGQRATLDAYAPEGKGLTPSVQPLPRNPKPEAAPQQVQTAEPVPDKQDSSVGGAGIAGALIGAALARLGANRVRLGGAGRGAATAIGGGVGGGAGAAVSPEDDDVMKSAAAGLMLARGLDLAAWGIRKGYPAMHKAGRVIDKDAPKDRAAMAMVRKEPPPLNLPVGHPSRVEFERKLAAARSAKEHGDPTLWANNIVGKWEAIRTPKPREPRPWDNPPPMANYNKPETPIGQRKGWNLRMRLESDVTQVSKAASLKRAAERLMGKKFKTGNDAYLAIEAEYRSNPAFRAKVDADPRYFSALMTAGAGGAGAAALSDQNNSDAK